MAVIGEAAHGLSAAFRADQPDLPWRLIIGMRHRLVHDYGGVALAVVWITVKERLPELLAQLDKLLPGPEGS